MVLLCKETCIKNCFATFIDSHSTLKNAYPSFDIGIDVTKNSNSEVAGSLCSKPQSHHETSILEMTTIFHLETAQLLYKHRGTRLFRKSQRLPPHV